MVRDYILRLCLDSPLFFKLVEFQLDKKVSKTYAGLLVFVEGMKSLGLINDDEYEFYKQRYDKPLEVSPIKVEPLPKPKCFICGREAVGIALELKRNKKQFVCEKHKRELSDHPKWKILE